jgi:hypothetical protein
MAVDNASGTVTIWQRTWLSLRADADGLVVRNFPFGRNRRIAWTEISHFADGKVSDGKGTTSWILLIVLRTGKQVPVKCTGGAPPSEVMAALRQTAQSHGVPADLAGVPTTKHGRPAIRGLYQDPGGRAGLRYWDGSQWSPLLPPEVGDWSSRTARKGPGSWSALPTADGCWTYPATRARYWTVWFAASVAAWAVLLTGGLVTVLWWDRVHHRHAGNFWFWVIGGLAVLYAFKAWRNRRFFRKLDEAVRGISR